MSPNYNASSVGTNMNKSLKTIPALLFLVAVVYSAPAGDLRLPATGQPAVTFRVPDKWFVDDENNGVRTILNRVPATIAFTFTVAKDARDPDAFIAGGASASAGPGPKRIGDADIDGCQGGLYTSTGKANSGTTVTFTTSVVRIDKTHLLAVTRMTSPKATAADLNLGKELLKNAKVIR